MRIIALTLILLAVIGYQAWDRAQVATDLQGAQTELESLRIEQEMKATQADSAATEASTEKARADKLAETVVAQAKTLEEHKKIGEEGIRAAKELGESIKAIQKERNDAEAEVKRLTTDLAAAKKAAAEAAKLAMKVQHDSCPPPTTDEAIAGETKELAPRIQRSTGEFAWPEDYQFCKTKAKELGRPQLTVFVTTSCVHCQAVDNDVLPVPRVGKTLFKQFVPCWVMVKNKKSPNYQLAEKMGVNEFRYPAVVIEYPDGRRLLPFRPSKDPDAFLKQVATKREQLEP
jgi:hypothetical protein